MAEQPNDNYARHDHLHDDVYTPIPTFEDHANDQVKHGGSMVPDYSTSARRVIPIDTMSRITPFTAPDNGIAVGNFASPANNMVVYAYINGIRTSFQSSSSRDYGANRDCLTIPLKKGDTLWFGDADGNSKQVGYLNEVYYPHWFYPYVHAANSVNGQIVYNNQPIGSVCWFDLEEAPDGWVVCNGKWYSEDGKLSSDTYTEVCTIQTPNLIGRYALGATTDIGNTVEAGLPNITGKTGSAAGMTSNNPPSGAFGLEETFTRLEVNSTTNSHVHSVWNFDASKGTTDTSGNLMAQEDSPYGNSDTVTPPSTKLLPCMKIFNAEETLLMSVPDYSQTIDIMQFPWTAIASGQIVLSWSIDNKYIVIPCVNGIRLCGFADTSTTGGYTTTFSVAKDDVVTIEVITSSNGNTADGPEILSMDGIGTVQGNNQLFILGSYHYVMYARFTPFKNQNISNLTGDVELHLGSHTGVHKAEATGDVTTTDPSKSVTVVKSANQMIMQQTIDNVPVDLTDPATTPSSQSGYVDIGTLRIIYGITPVIPREGSINQIVRIKLPQSVPTLLSVTTTIVMTGNNYNGSQITISSGPECTAQVLRVIDDYLYVYVDGHVSNINPEIAISYNIFTTK